MPTPRSPEPPLPAPTRLGAIWTCLVLLAACAPETETPVDARPAPQVTMVGDTAFLELPLGRSADNGDIAVTFDAVTEDSRCPRGAQCVWAGNAAVRLTLERGDETEVFVLGTAVEPRRASFGGYAIDLRDLAPYPASVEPVDRESYVARIAVVAP